MRQIEFDAVVGIDPGRNGGIALFSPSHYLTTVKMPKRLYEIMDFMNYVKSISENPIVFLEKVQLRSDDITDNPGKAFRVQKLLMEYQQLKDYIEISGVPYVMMHPMSWQSTLKLRRKGETKQERKNRYKEAAEHYYKGFKATLWNADAVLIMHAGRFKLKYEPQWVMQNLPVPIKQGLFDAKEKKSEKNE